MEEVRIIVVQRQMRRETKSRCITYTKNGFERTIKDQGSHSPSHHIVTLSHMVIRPSPPSTHILTRSYLIVCNASHKSRRAQGALIYAQLKSLRFTRKFWAIQIEIFCEAVPKTAEVWNCFRLSLPSLTSPRTFLHYALRIIMIIAYSTAASKGS